MATQASTTPQLSPREPPHDTVRADDTQAQPNGLSAAIRAYDAALDSLPADKASATPADVMRIVIARDQLARLLAVGNAAQVADLERITQLDRRFKSDATRIEAIAGVNTFASWRDAYQPPASAWWWRMDEQAAAIDANAYPLLQLLSSLLIVATSISLTIEIARRFLSTSSQFVGIFTTVSSALLALLGGTAFTQVGRRGLERALNRLRIGRRYLTAAKIGLALILLLMIFAINRLLPAFAVYFNNRAQVAQNARMYASAINDYQLAINLNPDYTDPYYNLASTYEDVLDYSKAIDAYQRVQAVAPAGYFNLARSYNNLARLYILYRNDYAGALKFINVAFGLQPTEPDIQYALYKNRGWALLKLKLYDPAQNDLRQALQLDASRPAAHCLLAQVLDAQGNAAAQPEWGNCVAYTTPERTGEVEAEWMATARYRLGQDTGQGGSK
jgi:tetratricopeptide (TPR) repeat protein